METGQVIVVTRDDGNGYFDPSEAAGIDDLDLMGTFTCRLQRRSIDDTRDQL